MTNYAAGELLLVEFPPERQATPAHLPMLVILDTGDEEVVVARVMPEPPQSMFDVTLADWKRAGLSAPATALLHKLETVAKTRVRRSLGTLTETDRQHVSAVLPQTIAAWQQP